MYNNYIKHDINNINDSRLVFLFALFWSPSNFVQILSDIVT